MSYILIHIPVIPFSISFGIFDSVFGIYLYIDKLGSLLDKFWIFPEVQYYHLNTLVLLMDIQFNNFSIPPHGLGLM